MVLISKIRKYLYNNIKNEFTNKNYLNIYLKDNYIIDFNFFSNYFIRF